MVAAKSRPQYDPKDVIYIDDDYMTEHRHRYDPVMDKSASSRNRQPESGTMHHDYREEGDFPYEEHQFADGYRIEENESPNGYRIEEKENPSGYRIEEKQSIGGYRIEEEEGLGGYRIEEEDSAGGYRLEEKDSAGRYQIDGEEIRSSFRKPPVGVTDELRDLQLRNSPDVGGKKKKKRGKKSKQVRDIPVVETVEDSFDQIEEEEIDKKSVFLKDPPSTNEFRNEPPAPTKDPPAFDDPDDCDDIMKVGESEDELNDISMESEIKLKSRRYAISKTENDREKNEEKEGVAKQHNDSRFWFASIMNNIFNPELPNEEEDGKKTDDDNDVPWHFIPCGRMPAYEEGRRTSSEMRGATNQTACAQSGCSGTDQQGCNAMDPETYSVSNFAHDFGDLQSLPSLEDSIIHRAGVGVELLSEATSKEFNGPMLISKLAELQRNEESEKIDGKDTNEKEGSGSDETLLRLTTDLSEAQQSDGQHSIRSAPILVSIADLFAEKGDFTTALNIEEQVVSIYSTKLGDSDNKTTAAKLRCAKALENVGKYDDAIEMYFGVMSMWKALNDEKDKTADMLLLIAHSLRLKGQYMQAIRELKRALKLYRECLGDAHASVASTVDEIASLYVTLGDFEKSAAILEEVVKLKAATLGMSNKKVSQSLVDLATSYECSENFELAIKALKKAYKIYTDLGGFSCEEATSTLQRIALIYQASSDMNKAGIAYLGVLRGKKHLLGDDHLDVAETYFRLGVCLRETDQLDKSLKCMKEALPILVGKGKDIADVEMIAEVMHEMALLYKSKGQLSEAARIFKQELTVRRKIGQPDYPCVANTLNHLGVTEYEMKLHKRAMKHLLEVLTIFQERSEQGIDFAEALFNIGLVFEALKNKERAYEAFLEAARVFKSNGYSKEHPHLVKAVNKVKRLAR